MANKKYFAVFILSELYYLPIYEPVAKKLKENNLSCLFLVRKEYTHRTTNTKDLAAEYLDRNGYSYKHLEDNHSDTEANYLFYSANGFKEYDIKHDYTVLMSHGIGTKGGYFAQEHTSFDIRFVEGNFRKEKMEELFPDMKTTLFDVGFAKLDPAIGINETEKATLMERYGLDISKKTILYSPTFYPSTIERIKKNFPDDFKDYNIIIKPHAFSYELNTYRKQRKIMNKWSQFSNVYLAPLEEFNLTPFMAIADVMMTDESSAMFEFIALDKPMICYRDVKLRLSYRLFKKKLQKRMEPHLEQFKNSFANAYSYPDLLEKVNTAITNPEKNSKMRQDMSLLLVGKTDGKVSERIVKHLQDFLLQKES